MKNKLITKIKKLKSKTVLYFPYKKIELDNEVLANFYLYEGKLLTNKEYNEIINFNNSLVLFRYALNIRKRNIYSEYRMREKLYLKKNDKSSVDLVIKRLKALNLLDDKMYALDYKSYGDSLLYGKNKIIKKLKEKGIFDSNLSSLSFPKKEEINKAEAYLKKIERKYDKYSNASKKNHLINALLSNGFEKEVALEVIDSMSVSSESLEYAKLKRDYLKSYQLLSRKYEGNELAQKVFNTLRSKGYRYNLIKKVMEESNYEIGE